MTSIDSNLRRIRRKVLAESTRLIKPINNYIFRNKLVEYKDYKKRGIVFIVAAPRTGSTFLYQILTNYLDVCYLSNLANLFYHSLYSGMVLHDFIYHNNPHNSYISDNGRTKKLNDVNESGKFWYQFYPSSCQIIQNDDIPSEKLLQLQNILQAIQHRFEKPLIFKNQHFAQRVSSLAELFPDSLFIHVKRDPLPTSKSIIRHRRRLNEDVNAWYSVKPENYKEIKNQDYKMQVVQQVHGVDKMIERQLTDLSEDRYLTVRYEDLSENWLKIVEDIYSWLSAMNNIHYRNSVEPPNFREPKTVTDDEESKELKKIIDEVYG